VREPPDDDGVARDDEGVVTSWLQRHVDCWFRVTYARVKMPDGRLVSVELPSDLAVHGWRVWRWTL
jgi:hypothetical protein